MHQNQGNHLLSEPRRREIFLALVEGQDRGQGVAESRRATAERFRVFERQLDTFAERDFGIFEPADIVPRDVGNFDHDLAQR